MGEVQCECQSQTIALTSLTQTSLPLALPQPWDQPASSPWMEELLANAMLFTWPMSNYTAPKLLDEF